MEALARFGWFLVAASVGFAWISAAKWSGAALESYGHAVFLSLFVAALAAGGHDVRAALQFHRVSKKLAEELKLSPEQLNDAERLAAALIMHDAEAVQAELDRRRRPRAGTSGRHKALHNASIHESSTDRERLEIVEPSRPITRPGDLPPRKEGRRR